MCRAGAPVPPGFTISTTACRRYNENGGKLPADIDLTKTYTTKFADAAK
jgi:phosphoenolpyruvate synthase/pyruvate phosphate dikinase